MGRLTMFEDLRDPSPPSPGLREFAIVAERAQHIRSRRAMLAVRVSSVVVVAAAAAGLYAISDESDRSSTGPRITPSTVAVAESPPLVTFDEARTSTALPPIRLAGSTVVVASDALIEARESVDRSICFSVDGTTVADSCSPAGASFAFFEWLPANPSTVDPAAQPGDPQSAQSTSVAIVVDSAVGVNFVTVGVTCTRIPGLSTAQVWTCAGLDLDAATVQFVETDRVIISTRPERD